MFDIVLPLTGPAGVECRSGGINGNYQVNVIFPGLSKPNECERQRRHW